MKLTLRSSMFPVLACGLLTGLLTTSHASLLVRGTVSPTGGGAYHYAFEVVNPGPDDFLAVSLVDAPLGDPLIAASLVAPADYLASYDAGLGIVDFLEFTNLFGASGVAGLFAFDSLAEPGTAFGAFEALKLDPLGDLYPGTVDLRAAGAVPDGLDALTPMLAWAGLCLAGAWVARRRGSRSFPVGRA